MYSSLDSDAKFSKAANLHGSNPHFSSSFYTKLQHFLQSTFGFLSTATIFAFYTDYRHCGLLQPFAIILHKPHPSSAVRYTPWLPYGWPLSSGTPHNQCNCTHALQIICTVQVQVQVKGTTFYKCLGMGMAQG